MKSFLFPCLESVYYLPKQSWLRILNDMSWYFLPGFPIIIFFDFQRKEIRRERKKTFIAFASVCFQIFRFFCCTAKFCFRSWIKIELNIWSLKRSLRTLSQTKKKQSRLVRHSQKNLTSREVRPTGTAHTTALWSRIKARFLVKLLICVRLLFGECYNVMPERLAFIPLISKMEFVILNSS